MARRIIIPNQQQLRAVEEVVRALPRVRRTLASITIDVGPTWILGVITGAVKFAPNRGKYEVRVKKRVDQNGEYVSDGPLVTDVLSVNEMGNTATHIFRGQQVVSLPGGSELVMELLEIGTQVEMIRLGPRFWIINQINGTSVQCGDDDE